MKLRPQVRLGAIVALAIAAGFVAWLVVRDHGSTTAPSGPNPTVAGSRGSAGPGLGPVGMSRAALVKLQRSVHHPIYWAGPKPGYTYELTQRRDGTIYVRYLPQGVRVGDPRGAFVQNARSCGRCTIEDGSAWRYLTSTTAASFSGSRAVNVAPVTRPGPVSAGAFAIHAGPAQRHDAGSSMRSTATIAPGTSPGCR